MRARRALLAVLLVAACTPAPRRRPAASGDLGWLPASATGLWAFPGAAAPVVTFVNSTLKERAPTCWKDLTAALDVWYMVQTHSLVKSVNVLQGQLDRDATEKCIVENYGLLTGEELSARRDGDITVITSDRNTVRYLAWTERGLAFDADRASVAAFLTPRKEVTTPLLELLATMDRTKGFWGAMAWDLTSKPLGVPSRGFLISGPWPIASPQELSLLVSVVFDDERAATTATEHLVALVSDASMPEPIRRGAAALKIHRDGARMMFDLAPMMFDMSMMKAFLALFPEAAALAQ